MEGLAQGRGVEGGGGEEGEEGEREEVENTFGGENGKRTRGLGVMRLTPHSH